MGQSRGWILESIQSQWLLLRALAAPMCRPWSVHPTLDRFIHSLKQQTW